MCDIKRKPHKYLKILEKMSFEEKSAQKIRKFVE